jgi:uncharacterized membrane protein
MHNRVAKTKSLATAWELIALLRAACPANEFVVIMRQPDASPEVHPVGPFHPIDKEIAQDTVRQFTRLGLEKIAARKSMPTPRPR